MTRLTDETIKAILDGCEHTPQIVATLFVARGGATARTIAGLVYGPDEYSSLVRLADVPHRDPDTIKALATEVLEARAALAAKDAEIARLTRERDEAERRGEDQWKGWIKADVEARKATARVVELTNERDEAYETADAHEKKWQSFCKAPITDGGTCGCSYDHPDHVCMYHSPQVATLEARVAELEGVLRDVPAALTAAYLQADEEQRGYDMTAGKHEKVVLVMRKRVGAALGKAGM
jgi:hypothetical protein